MFFSFLRRFFSYLLIIIAFYFIFRNIFKNWNEIRIALLNINWYFLIFSYLLLFPSLFLYTYAWQLILKELDKERNISFSDCLGIVVVSNLGKYVPGKVWFALSRIDFTKSFGFSENKIFLGILLESFFLFLSAFFYFIFFLRKYFYLPFLFLLLIITPNFFKLLFNFVLKIFKKERLVVSFPIKKLIPLLFLYILCWFFQGVAFFFLIKTFYFPISFHNLLSLIGIYALSWMLGFIVLIAPGGLGVREGSILLFLKDIFPMSIASLIALISRIWITIHELLNFLIFGLIFLTKIRKRI
ncbi:MAG: flippase-like domain-containing protein [candidate division WOR-3 bacterium]|nr:flippase-like domain-containing protein [candidate division WOR-3 bacterium]MCX7837653.1 flippase-like domain-containing protein [candidate division WOR-3 bacterium]MDW8114020.1 lysylphosphatidylglycerol synthase domain-containing protein [candidate division WOR-3 bacterium]